MGTQAAAGAQFGDDVFQVGGVLDGGGGDADDLAAGGDQFEGLLDALGGVHGVAGDHGLFDDGMIAADDDAAAGGIADDDFAGVAARDKRKATGSSAWFTGAGLGGARAAGLAGCSICVFLVEQGRGSEEGV